MSILNLKKYKPKHSKEEYYDLIMEEGIGTIRKNGRAFEAFSCASQHVSGCSPEECLDKIWDSLEEKKKRIKYYKTLPTLKEFLTSSENIEIDSNKMYYFKVNIEDACVGKSGDILIEDRIYFKKFGHLKPPDFPEIPKEMIEYWKSNIPLYLKNI